MVQDKFSFNDQQNESHIFRKRQSQKLLNCKVWLQSCKTHFFRWVLSGGKNPKKKNNNMRKPQNVVFNRVQLKPVCNTKDNSRSTFITEEKEAAGPGRHTSGVTGRLLLSERKLLTGRVGAPATEANTSLFLQVDAQLISSSSLWASWRVGGTGCQSYCPRCSSQRGRLRWEEAWDSLCQH